MGCRSPGTRSRRTLILLGLGVALLGLLSGCANVPHTTVMPKTDAARKIQDLYVLVFWLAVVVFIGVQGGLLYVLWRFRARPGHELPEQTHGNTTLEIGWTIAPAVILVIMAVPTIRTIFALETDPAASPDGSPPLVIEVTGHQWWWEFRYPEVMLPNGQPLTTANEMIVPTGRPSSCRSRSDNVIHSFWVPQLTGKIDAIPNHDNHLWFTAKDPGAVLRAMRRVLRRPARPDAHERHRDDADRLPGLGRADHAAAARQPTDVARCGAETFSANGCAACHTIDGVPAAAARSARTSPTSAAGPRSRPGSCRIPRRTCHAGCGSRRRSSPVTSCRTCHLRRTRRRGPRRVPAQPEVD